MLENVHVGKEKNLKKKEKKRKKSKEERLVQKGRKWK